jgi:hypothetical protein
MSIRARGSGLIGRERCAGDGPCPRVRQAAQTDRRADRGVPAESQSAQHASYPRTGGYRVGSAGARTGGGPQRPGATRAPKLARPRAWGCARRSARCRRLSVLDSRCWPPWTVTRQRPARLPGAGRPVRAVRRGACPLGRRHPLRRRASSCTWNANAAAGTSTPCSSSSLPTSTVSITLGSGSAMPSFPPAAVARRWILRSLWGRRCSS